MSEPCRQVVSRRVTFQQLEILWEALNSNRDLALGFNKKAQARELSRRMWEEIALNLNSQGEGAVKDWKGWCKYWTDYKSKLKKLSVAAAKSQKQTGGGPSSVKPMSAIEEKFLQILGPYYGLGLTGARVEPLLNVTQVESSTTEGSESLLHNLLLSASEPEPGPSWRMTPALHPHSACGLVETLHLVSEPPMPLTSTQPATALPAQPSATPSPTSLSGPPATTPRRMRTLQTPRGSPRRRRFRREPPISADAARRILIRESQRRAENDEQNSLLFRQLIDEIKEIKNLLSRFNARPTGAE